MFADLASDALSKGVELDKIVSLPVRVDISRAKFIPEAKLETFDELERKVQDAFDALVSEVEHV